MADKLHGNAKAGAVSVSAGFLLINADDGTSLTGKVAADLTASYWRQGGVRVAISLSDLGSVNAAYSSGGVKEVDPTNMPGLYRLDLPDAALATGADWVNIAVVCTGAFDYHERLALETVGDAEVYARIGAPAGASIAADLAAILTSVGGVAAAVWAVGTRTLTSFGTLVADVWGHASRTLTAAADSSGVTSLLASVGAWTGTGVNNILGAFRALARTDATLPSDIGGTFASTTDSLQAIRDRGDVAWITGAGGGGGGAADPDMCEVIGYLRDGANQPLSGVEIGFQPVPVTPLTPGDLVVAGGERVTVVTDPEGYFAIELIRSSVLEGDYRVYCREANINGEEIEVPDSAQVNLSTLL